MMFDLMPFLIIVCIVESVILAGLVVELGARGRTMEQLRDRADIERDRRIDAEQTSTRLSNDNMRLKNFISGREFK